MPWMVIGPYEEYETLIDDVDLSLFHSRAWTFDGRYVKYQQYFNAEERELHGKTRETFYLHREIIKPPKGLVIDHKDGNGLNNSRENLRVTTQKNNCRNKEVVGVYWRNDTQRWQAQITFDGKKEGLGSYDTFDEAVEAYRVRAKEVYGEFAFDYETNAGD